MCVKKFKKNFRLKRLNKRAVKSLALQTIEPLDIKKGETIIDIGVGGGLLTFEFSRLVGSKGFIIAADIKRNLLNNIEEQKKVFRIKNIKTLYVEKVEDLQEFKYDLIYMRNVFHHIENPIDYFSKLRECLKEDGRIAIIDWNEKAGFFLKKFGHYTVEQDILDVMNKSGFKLKNSYGHLKLQSFNIFDKA